MGFIRRVVFGLPEARSLADVTPSGDVTTAPRRPETPTATVSASLGLDGVYRAVSILATTVGQLDLATYKQGRPVDSPPIVERPDVDTSRRAFMRTTATCLATHGNAYWRVFRDPDGFPTSLRVLNPHSVLIEWDRRGRRFYRYAGDQIPGKPSREVTIPDADMRHLPLLEVPGSAYGLGPIQADRLGLTGALDLQRYANKLFRDGSIPTGVLSSTQQLNEEQADAYRRRWHETQAERDIAVLGQGLTYEPILLKPADAQYLQSRQYSVTEQARLFGIPASYMLAEVNGQAMTYQNLEQVDQSFIKFTAMQYLNVIEDAITSVTPRGQTQRFRAWDFMRPDSRERAEVHEIYLRNSVVTAEEVRAMEHLGPRSTDTEGTPVNG